MTTCGDLLASSVEAKRTPISGHNFWELFMKTLQIPMMYDEIQCMHCITLVFCIE